MKNYIGPRMSGKTTKLLKDAAEYLDSNTEAKVIFISPNYPMSMCAEHAWRELFDIYNDRIAFISSMSYLSPMTACKFDKTKAVIFIDQIDYILKNVFGEIYATSMCSESNTFKEIKK